MACSKPTSDPGAKHPRLCDCGKCDGSPTPSARLEDVDTSLYHLRHICALLSAFAGQHGDNQFTDGIRLETYAVVFGWISDELDDVRLDLEEINKALIGGAA